MRILIVIPAYNEQENIERVVDDLIQNYPQYDYLVVNDGSKDRTAAICREKGYHFLDLPVNLGLAGAFQAGLRYADRMDYDMATSLMVMASTIRSILRQWRPKWKKKRWMW